MLVAVRFVIGRAGTGKTWRCVHALAEALSAAPLGPALLWIVPEQGTFQAQRALLMAPGVKGSFRVQVLGFRRLTRMLAGELGLEGGAELDDLARAVLLGDLVAETRGELEVFAAVADRPGFVERLDGMLVELQQAGHTGASLRALAEQVASRGGGAEDDPVLARKLRDLARLLEAWDAALAARNIHSERLAAQVAERVGESRLIAGARIWIDAFSAFNVLEMRLITELARYAQDVEITVLADGAGPGLREAAGPMDETGLFYRTERMARLLQRQLKRQGIRVEKSVFLDSIGAATEYSPAAPRRFVHVPALGVLEQRLFTAGGHSNGSDAADTPSLGANAEILDPGPAGRSAGDGAIELWEAATPSVEVHAAAQKIRALVAGGGYRYRDIGLIVPALEDYADAIRRIFTQHHIPHFIDQRRTISHHPLIEFLRSAIAWVLHGFLTDDLALLLKTGLTSIPDFEAQRLENYLLAHGLDRCDLAASFGLLGVNLTEDQAADADNQDSADLAQRAELDLLNRVRQELHAALGEWTDLARQAMGDGAAAGVAGATLARGLYGLLVRCGVPGQIEKLIEHARAAQDQELLMIHQQAWRQTMGLLETLERILHGRVRPTTLEDFSRIVAGALESLSLGLIPPTLDQVLVSSVQRSRHPELKVAVILGASENRFPLVHSEDPLLNDHQRAIFNNQVAAQESTAAEARDSRGKSAPASGPIIPGSDRLLLEAQFYDYVAFTRASERLIVSYPLADEQGRAVGQSPYIARLRRLFGQLRPRLIGADQLHDLTALSTLDDALAASLTWARQTMLRGTGDGGPPWRLHAAVYDWLVGPQPAGVQTAVARVWQALLPEAPPRLSADLAAGLWPRDIRMSVSQLEHYAACPLQYFMHYALGLSLRPTLELDGLQTGTLYHRILEQVYDEIIAGRLRWPDGSADALARVVADAVDAAAAELHAELAAQLPSYAKMRERTKKTLGIVAEAQRRAALAGDLRPAATELVFGMPPSTPQKTSLPALALETGAGRRVKLRGKIDRVDVSRRGGQCVVIDYKSGSGKTLELHLLYHGIKLQLAAYLLALQGQTLGQGASAAGPLQPVAAFFAPLGISRKTTRDLDDLVDPTDDAFYQAYKPRGMLNADAITHLDATVDEDEHRKSGWYPYARNAPTKKGAGPLAARGNDAWEAADFALLLRFAAWRIACLVDEMAAGNIAPAPYRDGGKTPCTHCDYVGLCAFDRARGAYRELPRLKRAEALEVMQADLDLARGGPPPGAKT